MPERKFCLSSPQLFCLLFFHLLSGMMLFCGGELFPALFAALFAACVCVAASAVCGGFCSSAELFGAAFGKLGAPLRYTAAFFASLPLARTLLAFSAEISSFYGEQNAAAFAPVLALFACLALSRGFHRASRFAELCVFALVGALLLALFGGGDGVKLDFSESALFSALEAVGASPLFFSLYLRHASRESEKMSDFAKNSAFHPSPLASGLCAVLSSLAVYAFFCFAAQESILFSLLSWFFALSRILLLSLCLADLTAYPEKSEGAKRAFVSSLFCAFWLIFGAIFPNTTAVSGVFAAVLFPCIVFVTLIAAKRAEFM